MTAPTDIQSWKVGSRSIVPFTVDDPNDRDPRGILWMFEEPRSNANYIVSVDPTVGRTGWSRYGRTEDDIKVDNAAIEVIRTGKPDVQVAEWGAPVDAVDLAPIVNALGRLYCGSNEEGQALVIGEVTGPGAVTLRELIDRFGYVNHWRWTQWGGATTKRTNQFWWWSSRSANKDLWMRGLHHIHKGGIKIRSPYLVEEMADCVADAYTLIGEARFGRHDDRVMSLLFGLWAAHDWSTSDGYEEAAVVDAVKEPSWQASDVTVEEMSDLWNERMESLQGG